MGNAAKSRFAGSEITTEASAEAAAPAPKSPLGSGGDRKVLALPGRLAAAWKARLARSVWLPILGRSAVMLVTMGVLAGVGAASTLQGEGVSLTSQASAIGLDEITGVWLAPAPSASTASSPSWESRATAAPTARKVGSTPASSAMPPAAAPSPPPTSSATPPSPEQTPQPGVTADGKVILNTASVEELTRLPRVGPKKAQAIADLRERLGRFRKPTDLLRVKGIGVKTLRQMLPHLVLDPPDES